MAILGGGPSTWGPQRGVWGPKSQGHSATGSPQERQGQGGTGGFWDTGTVKYPQGWMAAQYGELAGLECPKLAVTVGHGERGGR